MSITLGVFPRSSAPAQDIVVADIRGFPEWSQFSLLALQGLVNREQPRLYFNSYVSKDFHDYVPVYDLPSEVWLETLERDGHTLTYEPNPRALFGRFRDLVKGAVIYDDTFNQFDHQMVAPQYVRNMAVMLAAQHSAIPIDAMGAKYLGLPVVDNLCGRWSSAAQAYRWALDVLLPECNEKVVACVPQGCLNMVDYLVAFKIFVAYRPNQATDEEKELFVELLRRMKPGAPLMGQWGIDSCEELVEAGIDFERDFIDLLSEHGHWFLPAHETANLTVHSGTRPVETKIPQAGPVKLEKDKYYVGLVYSEGDNIAWQVINRKLLWDDPQRGNVPVGWTTTCAMYDLCPNLMRYYIETSSAADCHVGPVSGIGYCFPYRWGKAFGADREKLLQDFLEYTNKFYTEAGLSVVQVLDHTESDYSTPRWSAERFGRYAPAIKGLFCGYPCLWDQGAKRPEPYSVDGHTAVVHTEIPSDTKDIAAEIRKFARNLPKPGFIYAMASGWSSFPKDLVANLRTLDSDFILVRPDQLAQLIVDEMTST